MLLMVNGGFLDGLATLDIGMEVEFDISSFSQDPIVWDPHATPPIPWEWAMESLLLLEFGCLLSLMKWTGSGLVVVDVAAAAELDSRQSETGIVAVTVCIVNWFDGWLFG